MSRGSTVFMAAQLPILIYSSIDNTFSGTLTNLVFNTDAGSIWVDDTINYLNPDWPLFDPGVQFLFTVQPDANMSAITQSFSINGSSGGSNSIEAASVPAPSTFFLLVAGLFVVRWRRALLALRLHVEQWKTLALCGRHADASSPR